MPSKFHRQQYYIASALAGLCLILYVFAPASKTEVIVGVMMSFVGFITGKFSNGYGKKAKEHEDGS